jgi:hypothetical protein
MSELTKTNGHEKFLRGYLLASVCGLALAASAAEGVMAQDAERPTVWIELGGQLERMANSSEVFAPPFLDKFDPGLFRSPLPVQQSLRYSNGAEGRISFEPAGTDIVASVSARYGRSNGRRADYQRLPAIRFPVTSIGATEPTDSYESPPRHFNGATDNTERHLIVDFRAGKDIGVGMFGGHDAMLVSLGVRFAQFTASTHSNINGVPDFTEIGHEFKYTGVFQSHHRYTGDVDVERSFRGLGPALSWDSSARLLGRGDDSEITLDWGINGSVLFGRQRVTGERNITGSHYKSMQKFPKYGTAIQYNGIASSYRHPNRIDRSRSVIVPNVGGFAGLSFRYINAKLSLGYRADFFFGAMDGGIDARKTYDRNFYGPFATISVGLGD